MKKLRPEKNIDQKKSTGRDKIPTKLVQLSAEMLSTPLSSAINNSNKYSVSNFRPVHNIFSKMYEEVLKNMLVEKMNDHFSPFVSANRERKNFQHLLIRLREEWRLHLDNNYFVRAVMTDLSKAFHCIPYDVLTVKLEAYG